MAALDGFRAAGLPVTSVLMDLATYERYEQFGTSTDARGNPLTATACRPLAHLTDAEQQLYECLTDPLWTRHRRVEQERIPLSVAADAVQAQLAAQTHAPRELPICLSRFEEPWHRRAPKPQRCWRSMISDLGHLGCLARTSEPRK